MPKPLKFNEVEQNSDEWFAMRLGKATMSNAPKFMANLGKAFGEPAKAYALQLSLEQVTGRKSGVSFTNEHMLRGQEQEPIARELYEHENFVTVTNGGFFASDTWGSSPDGLVGDDGIIEIKSVISTTHYATLKRGAHDPAYHWQLMGHLHATGRAWVDFVSYCADFPEGKQLITHRVHRTDVETDLKSLDERLNEFLQLIETTKESIQ